VLLIQFYSFPPQKEAKSWEFFVFLLCPGQKEKLCCILISIFLRLGVQALKLVKQRSALWGALSVKLGTECIANLFHFLLETGS
jgi:hypothetical protein